MIRKFKKEIHLYVENLREVPALEAWIYRDTSFRVNEQMSKNPKLFELF